MSRRASVLLGVGGLTLAARVVGFGRSLVFSKTVGDTCLGDVYNAANALPNVLFEVAAGGVLAGVVVPVVARHLGAGRPAEARRTTSALLTWTLLVLTVVALAALVGAGTFARAYAKADCAGSATVLATLVVMFVPQVWFYGVAVVSAGVLQAHGRFLAAAAAPLLSSVVVVAAYLLFAALAAPGANRDLGLLDRPALLALGLGTTAGVVALALCTAVPLARLGLRPGLRFPPGDARVVLAIGAAGLAGLVLQQVSVLVVNLAAQRSPDPGALTRFTWANALYLLPYAVLAAPLLQLTFPRLAAAAERGPAAVGDVLGRTAPALVVLAALGAAVLAATAVPVARVFVLGPGSGRTGALAAPVAALAPAVLAFALMGLATRTLLAQHRALAAGTTTALAWGTVTVAAVVVMLAVPAPALVAALAGCVSLGLVVGAVVGWAAVRSGGAGRPGLPGLPGLPALAAGVGAAVPAVLAGGALGRLASGSDLPAAAGLAVAAALLATAVFVGVLALVRPRLLRATWALRHADPRPEAPDSVPDDEQEVGGRG